MKTDSHHWLQIQEVPFYYGTEKVNHLKGVCEIKTRNSNKELYGVFKNYLYFSSYGYFLAPPQCRDSATTSDNNTYNQPSLYIQYDDKTQYNTDN